MDYYGGYGAGHGFSLRIEDKQHNGLVGIAVIVTYSGVFPGSVFETITGRDGFAWIRKPTEFPLHVESLTIKGKKYQYIFEARNNCVKFFTLRH